MTLLGKIQTKNHGFTVVELLLVIVVIGILATIAIVVYPGYLKQTHDSERKSDLQQISAALSSYVLKNNSYIADGSGCGLSGNGNGWLNAGPNTWYPKSISTCLQEAGVLTAGTFVDPSSCVSDSGGACGSYRGNPVPAYMKVTCTKNSKTITYLLAYLENSPQNKSAIDALCDSGSASGFDSTGQMWGTNYGMNYYVIVK